MAKYQTIYLTARKKIFLTPHKIDLINILPYKSAANIKNSEGLFPSVIIMLNK
ncbi:hypothetical protein [Vagococcus sp. WN89Y]|uniref:hypothetical protein n=1 Tax=Vagococcus sp. WN89Y TaxID=3457258 RepID=UPI003FCD7F0D